jgi:hypothetical protein
MRLTATELRDGMETAIFGCLSQGKVSDAQYRSINNAIIHKVGNGRIAKHEDPDALIKNFVGAEINRVLILIEHQEWDK